MVYLKSRAGAYLCHAITWEDTSYLTNIGRNISWMSTTHAWLGLIVRQIVNIYVHLDRGDPQGLFARAISSDGRSYKDEVWLLSWNFLLKKLDFINELRNPREPGATS